MPKEEGAESAGPKVTVMQTQAAGLLAMNVWDSWVTKIVWACKWGPNGLVPVRPTVVFTGDVKLAAGHALKLF